MPQLNYGISSFISARGSGAGTVLSKAVPVPAACSPWKGRSSSPISLGNSKDACWKTFCTAYHKCVETRGIQPDFTILNAL